MSEGAFVRAPAEPMLALNFDEGIRRGFAAVFEVEKVEKKIFKRGLGYTTSFSLSAKYFRKRKMLAEGEKLQKEISIQFTC